MGACRGRLAWEQRVCLRGVAARSAAAHLQARPACVAGWCRIWQRRAQCVLDPRPQPRAATAVPRRPAGILVACSNGRQYSIDVLEALEEEG